MNKSLQQVAEFHSTFEHPIAEGPYTKESLKIRQLRIKLLFEELAELAEASDCKGTFKQLCDNFLYELTGCSHEGNVAAFDNCKDGDNVDKVEELDALCDIQYVLNGKILTSGLHKIFDKAFDTVHNNNMTKAHKDKEHARETVRKILFVDGNEDHAPKITERNGMFIVTNRHGKVLKPHDHVKVKLDIDLLLTHACPNCGEKENIHANMDYSRSPIGVESYLCNKCGEIWMIDAVDSDLDKKADREEREAKDES